MLFAYRLKRSTEDAVLVSLEKLYSYLEFTNKRLFADTGRFGKVTGYEEPEFLECKGVKTGTRVQLKSDIPLPCGLMAQGPHCIPGQPRTCWRCGLEGHEARLCPNKRCSRCLQVGHTLAECKGISFATRVGKRAISPVYAQTAHTPREWLRAWLKRSLSRPLTPYHMMLLVIAPVSDTTPRGGFVPPFVSDLSPDRTCRDCQPAH
ncbi:hypothetical protein BSL78_19744 [Apostichopus japonicus]|uniref:CCHC-type domain-containing protein n=1 Tax=Stichopus japonicus TaxID=307972 RepID=A0A2G8K636_STIJA|nr:hypothetical protein BSL78_19744 [Apostichopus japonicus]